MSPRKPHRPQELARTLGIKKDLSSRVLHATRKKDPMAVAPLHARHPDALRRLLASAEKRDVPPRGRRPGGSGCRRLRGSDPPGSPATAAALDSIVSAWLPDATREGGDGRAARRSFRGNEHDQGRGPPRSALSTAILHPCADGMHHDAVVG